MAIPLNDLKLTSAASTLVRKLPAADTAVLAAADRAAAINQDLITVLRPDLLGRPDLLADSSHVDTARAAAILAAVDSSLLGTLRPDLADAVLRPDLPQATATAGISRVSPGELITADKINAIIDRLNALGGKTGVNLGGDVTGAAGASRVVALQGRGVAGTAPAQGQVLGFANGVWQPTTPAQASTQPVAMRLVAAGTVSTVAATDGSGRAYRVSSTLGNLRGGGNGSPGSFGLIFDGYDSRNTYVAHTSQRQVAEGRGSERPQFVARIDPAADPRFPSPGLGFKVYGAAPNIPPQPVIQEQVLAGELFVEIYQPPLTFSALPLATDFAVAAIGTVEAARLDNPPKIAEPATTPGAALASNPGTVSGVNPRTGIADTPLRIDAPTAPHNAMPTAKPARSPRTAAKAAPTPPAKARKR